MSFKQIGVALSKHKKREKLGFIILAVAFLVVQHQSRDPWRVRGSPTFEVVMAKRSRSLSSDSSSSSNSSAGAPAKAAKAGKATAAKAAKQHSRAIVPVRAGDKQIAVIRPDAVADAEPAPGTPGSAIASDSEVLASASEARTEAMGGGLRIQILTCEICAEQSKAHLQ